MSQPFPRHLHPFDAARYPCLEPEVVHAILTRLAFDQSIKAEQRVQHGATAVKVQIGDAPQRCPPQQPKSSDW